MNIRKPVFMCEFLGTPEAGKTTTIHNVKKSLEKRGYSCQIMQESAEKVPVEYKKILKKHIFG